MAETDNNVREKIEIKAENLGQIKTNNIYSPRA